MKTKHLAFGALLLLSFAALAFGVLSQAPWLLHFDGSISAMATKAIDPVNTTIFKMIAVFGSPLVAIGLTMGLSGWLAIKHDLAGGLWVGGAQLVGSALASVLKQLIARTRPLHQLVPDTGYSFPSGHVFCTTILVLALLTLWLPRIKDQESQLLAVLSGIVWIGLVACARVYLRDHYATDVIASVLLAGGYWLLITPYATMIQRKLRQYLPERIVIR